MVEIRKRQFEYRNRTEEANEVFIDNVPVEMGEGVAEVDDGICKIHGETKCISGYNQGGYDGMSVCLLCCKEIIENLPK